MESGKNALLKLIGEELKAPKQKSSQSRRASFSGPLRFNYGAGK